MPVGRLDFMTEGLLLLTNDGELKRQLELPRTGVVRTYRARAYGQVTQEQLEQLAEGMTIEGMRYGSINANLERRTGSNCWIEMSLTEGKNREVRRVLAHLGLQVSRLIRTAYGPFTVDGLEPWRVDEIAGASSRRSARRSNEDHRRRVAGPDDRSAARLGDAANGRPGPRDPVLDAREPAR